MSDLPDHLHNQPSVAIAAFQLYSGLQFIMYDPARGMFIFSDPERRAKSLVAEFNVQTVTVDLHRFFRSYKTLLTEKITLDRRLRIAKRAVDNGK